MYISVIFPLTFQMDYPTALWAALRLGVVPSCANPIYTPTELVHQLKLSKSQYILTHPLFLKTAVEAARQVGIPDSKIILVAKAADNLPYVTIPDLIKVGATAPEITPLKLAPGESKRKVALLNFSSGTSGLAKGVLITHSNVIANVCQFHVQEGSATPPPGAASNGCLPFFHSILPYVQSKFSLWFSSNLACSNK
jgi:4-coumarate--CoA ligase